ncbi:phosphatidate cytidylyltransferase [Falsigemmobacter faecalis]|uniref:Phosphatidate cytidylyltransferase n=1 Tax=Falsigemmobacter faecalis TaxID=2488730 RepID=A0A3P3D7J2_9RHOB|nr:phosphatidate cytidylyltransferase [Falsigemmobacter faecalis]RRH69764.1 phosphatidate cytidylyltransferase [Falsigemmobacter faecalis]
MSLDPFLTPTAIVCYALFALLGVAEIAALKLKPKMDPASWENLRARIRSWWVMVFVFGTIFWLGRGVITLFFAFCSFAALREFATVTHTRRADHSALALAFWLILPLQYLAVYMDWALMALLMIPLYAFILLPVITVLKGEVSGFLNRVSETQWGLMICVYFVSHIPAVLSLQIPDYRFSAITLITWLILVVQASDVLQYVWGKALGKRLLAPKVSPSKTVEGLVGGVLSATLIGVILTPITPFTPLMAGLTAFAVCVMGVFGGLILSAIKRDRGVKDWGHLIRGHGGFLDRLDSLVFSAPIYLHLLLGSF